MDVPLETPVEKTFREYAESYFNLNRKGLFGKKTTIEKVTCFKAVRRTELESAARGWPGCVHPQCCIVHTGPVQWWCL